MAIFIAQQKFLFLCSKLYTSVISFVFVIFLIDSFYLDSPLHGYYMHHYSLLTVLGLAMQVKLALNSQSFDCLYILSAKIKVMCYHAQLTVCLLCFENRRYFYFGDQFRFLEKLIRMQGTFSKNKKTRSSSPLSTSHSRMAHLL